MVQARCYWRCEVTYWAMDGLRLSFGRGGWVALDGLDHTGVLYLRFRDRNNWLCIAELYLDASQADDAIDDQDFSAISLGGIEAQVNAYFSDEVRANLRSVGPDISTLATYFNYGLGNRGPVVRQVLAGNWVVTSLAAQQYIPASKRTAELTAVLNGEEVTVSLTRPERRDLPPVEKWAALAEEVREFRLQHGPSDGLTDEFLGDVARAYNAAVARGERPNASIRDQLREQVSRDGGDPDSIKLRTVQSWVYAARMRDLLDRPRRPGAGG